MKLLEVELVGFKSFAQKTTFRFHNGLTAVIGPNGSGKSNFTEAVRWVLGEQSLKQLRGQDSTDVIFSGSTSAERRGYASVTLTLSNESGRLPVDAAEVVLGRRINRSGESEYTLNGDPVRLHEVQQLLADAGIGTKSYTVISQGTVDRYLTATPAGRRELFDEATGVKGLQLKMQRAERTLSAAQRKADELQVVLRELEPRLRVLKRQMRELAEKEHLVTEHAAGQAAFFYHERAQLQQRYDQATAAITAAHAARTTARQAREAAEQRLLTLVAQQSAGTEGMGEQQLRAQLRQAETAYQTAREAYAAAERQRQELTASLQSARQARQSAERNLQHARQTLPTTNVFKPYRQALQRCTEVLHQLVDGSTPSPTTVATLRDEIADLITHHPEENDLVSAAQLIVEQMAGPLQAVARAEAIEHDRQRQLNALPTLMPPDDTPLRTLRNQAAQTPSSGPSAQSPAREEAEAQLNAARQAELVAERVASAAETKREHIEAELATLDQEILREQGSAFLHMVTTTLPPEQTTWPSRADLEHLAGRIAQLGTIDPLAQQEFQEVSARAERLREHLADVAETQAATTTLLRSLRTQIQHQFRQQFSVIQTAFTTYFQQLFGGGSARLTLVTSPAEPSADDADQTGPAIPGVDILVHPPGKQLQHVQLLSGGEKALTSLALLFAILKVQQPPFLILDEVDAALDEANSHRFSELLRIKSETTQCIVISHNRETMSHADMLYGITMQQDGISKVYSVKLADIATAAPAEMTI